MRRYPACDENADSGAGAQEARNLGCGVNYLLKIVEDEKECSIAKVINEFASCTQSLGDRRAYQPGISERMKRHPPNAIGKPIKNLPTNLQRDARFSNSPSTDDRC